MKLKITETDLLTLNRLKGKMLMLPDNNRLYCIMNFKIEEESETIVQKKGFWKKTSTTTVKKQLYMTAVDINAWHPQGKFLGTLSHDSAQWILRRDLYYIRQNWINFCEQLEAFGLKIVEIPETKENPDMEKAAKDHMKKFFEKEGYENEQDIIKYAVSFANSLK